MKNFFSINRRQAEGFVTIIILLFLVAGFYLIYVPEQEKSLNASLFRSLGRVSDNMHIKLDNHYSLLENYLRAYTDTTVFDSVPVKNFIQNYSTDDFELGSPGRERAKRDSAIDSALKRNPGKSNGKTQQNTNEKNGNYDRRNIKRKYNRSLELSNDANGNTFSVVVGQWKHGELISLASKIYVDRFVKPLLRNPLFDEYLVLDGGRVIYESFPSGFSAANMDSLFQDRNGITASRIRDIEIGGVSYKMFLQPVQFDLKNKWVICALVNTDKYKKLRTSLPDSIVLFLLMITSLGILMVPLLKILLMGNRERLTVPDIIASYFCCLLLVTLTAFFFLKYNFKASPDHESVTKKNLSKQISASFKKELRDVYTSLKNFDKLLTATDTLLTKKDKADSINFYSKSLRHNLVNIPYKNDTNKNVVSVGNIYLKHEWDSLIIKKYGNTWLNNTNNQKVRDNLIKEEITKINKKIKPKFDTINSHQLYQIFWLDKSGNEVFNWNADSPNTPNIMESQRSYFKNILSGKVYSLAVDSDTLKNFYIEPLVSWTSGTFRTVVSTRSVDTNLVAAFSCKMNSVTDVVMTPGYGFAVIDENGEVLFHSDRYRNMNENFIKETENNSELTALMFAGKSGEFDADYDGKKHFMHLDKISGLPFYIVVFSDPEYLSIQNVEAFGFNFLMYSAFFVFMCLEMVLLVLLSSRPSKLQKHSKVIEWIIPDNRFHYNYLAAMFVNLAALITGLFLLNGLDFMSKGVFVFLISSWITLLMNIIYFIYTDNRSTRKRRLRSFILLALIIILLNAWAGCVLCNFYFKLFTGQVILVITSCIFIYIIKYYKSKNNNAVGQELNFIRSYTGMALSRFLVTGALPVIFFFISAFNHEETINTRVKHVDYLNQLAGVLSDSSKFYDFKNDQNKIQSGIYIDSSWIKEISFSPLHIDSSSMSREKLSDTLFSKLRLVYKSSVLNGMYLSGDSFKTNTFSFYDTDSSHQSCINYLLAGNTAPVSIKIFSKNFCYSLCNLSPFQLIFFCLLILIVITVFYFFLFRWIKRLFAVDVPNLSKFKKVNEDILRDNALNRLVFVNGCPGGGKKAVVKDCLPDSKIYELDLIKIPDDEKDNKGSYEWRSAVEKSKSKDVKVILIDHFEYNIRNQRTNRIKLNLIEELLQVKHPKEQNETQGGENKSGKNYYQPKLIIISTVHQLSFLKSLERYGMQEEIKAEEKKKINEDLYRWTVLLGHFFNIYVPLLNNIKEDKIDLTSENVAQIITYWLAGEFKTQTNVELYNDPEEMKKLEALAIEAIDKLSRNEETATIHFSKVMIPAGTTAYMVKELTQSNFRRFVKCEAQRISIINSIIEECRYSPFLFRKKDKTIQFIKQEYSKIPPNLIDRDEVILEIQNLAYLFYEHIWESLTYEERFIVYDMAEDGLVNYSDAHHLSVLINKGIVINKYGRLMLFNISFRNFVLTSISKEDAVDLEKQIKNTGSWKSFRGPLLIVIAAIAIFMFTSQQELYAKIISILTAVSTLIPLLIRTSSSIVPASGKSA